MAHFESYNTSDPNTGSTPLGAGQSITPIVIQAQQYGALAYTCIADQVGSFFIDQSFDGGAHWDYTQTFPVTAGTGIGGQVSIYAPLIQVRFTNTAASAQTYLRLFVRAFGVKAA